MNKQDKEQFEDFHDKLDAINDCVRDISFTLNSDPKTGRVGMAEQTKINTSDILSIKTENKVRLGKVSVITGIFGILFGVVGGLATKYFFR